MQRGYRLIGAIVAVFVLASIIPLGASAQVTQAELQEAVDQAVNRAMKDKGQIVLGSPAKYPYLFHTLYIEKGDWLFGMGIDFNWQNTFISDDELGGVSDFTGWDEIEYRFGARLDKWLDFYVTADFASNEFLGVGPPPVNSGVAEGDVRWAIMDMHALPIPLASNLRIGQQILPVTIDNWTSPQNGSFIHKSYIGAFAGAYHHAMTFWDFKLRGSPKLVWAFGIAKQSESAPVAGGNGNFILEAQDSDENDDVDIYGQLGWYPWFRGPADMLYLEVSGGIFQPDNGTHTFAFPGIGHGVGTPALSAVTADDYTPLYLSGRYGNGPFWLLSEYADVEASSCVGCPGGASAEADMWHVTLGYFLTGETKAWGPPVGVNSRTKPSKPFNPMKMGQEGYGMGGLEFKARFQEIDMSEFSNFLLPGPGGTERENWAIGLNWYITENMIFMTEYEVEELKEFPGDPEIKLFNTQVNFRM